MEKLEACPICDHSGYELFVTCKDHTVSKEEFTIVKCNACGFKYTNPRPSVGELGKYYKAQEYISHSDTQKGIVNRLYHIIRKYTLLKKLQLIVRLCGGISKSNPKTLLDIGCGTGAFLEVCNNAGFNCVGIEPDDQARELATLKSKLNVKDENGLNDLKAGGFDIITLWHVLEHVPLLNERIEKIKELLKPTGHALIAVPNCKSLDAKHYEKYWAAFDVPRHLYHFRPEDIKALFIKHNMELEQILPMRFDSFYVSMLSEKYKSGKLNLLKSIAIGLKSNISAIQSAKNEFSSQIYIVKKN